MKNILFFIFLLVLSNCSAQSDSMSSNYDDFSLTYISIGLGSSMGSKQPVFRINRMSYLYTLEQNSFYGERTLKSDTICSGIIRKASIDSIINLVKNIDDTLIYNTTIGIMSGGVVEIGITYAKINLTFRLHNASNPIAEKIVAILNSNTPKGVRKLQLFMLFGNE